jgi:hypothetical protein
MVTVVTLFMFSCSIFDYKMSLKILDITQDPDSPPDQCGIARVELMVRNTGWGEIDYYDIYVDVTCYDGSVYSGETGGLNLPSDTSRTESMAIDTEGKLVDKGEVIDVKYGVY